MKRILITGKNSYIGNSFEKWVSDKPEEYKIDKISVRDDSWKETDFSVYNTVLHLAGIAHVSRDPKLEEKYYRVNRDLTIEVAEHAKEQGVKQFIFMSSIIVYGDSTTSNQVIDRNTVPRPSNFYGNSKLQAEKGIQSFQDNCFNIVIIRPPMIYGKGSKGNYPKLAKAARKLPVFPDIENQRSMLHIDNLCEFIKLMIDNNEFGLFFPQNKECVKTSEMVKKVGEFYGKNIKLTKVFNPFLKPLIGKVGIANKVFGNLTYDHTLSYYNYEYCLVDFQESIEATERRS